ncbi:hypothetical protein [Parasutterella muris]|uniref:Uncharacterized protein n=1 Tax=Parasutterella muris TaxID=2565572 RepID=A0A6L6YHF2_9BURK|nr:hypothetical protein [Parasutterella muris]MVX56814.1 hypothetical protein [Parasutterella muris]
MTLKYKPDMVKFSNEILVTEENLDSCAMNQSGLTSYYSSQKASADRQLNLCKLAQEITYANLYKEFKEKLISSEERYTDKTIDSMIKTEPKYIAVAQRTIDAQEIRDQLQACVTALIDRKKNIQQLLDSRTIQAGGAVGLTTRNNF